jgi:tetratricopeptide (TPR) repeat protein
MNSEPGPRRRRENSARGGKDARAGRDARRGGQDSRGRGTESRGRGATPAARRHRGAADDAARPYRRRTPDGGERRHTGSGAASRTGSRPAKSTADAPEPPAIADLSVLDRDVRAELRALPKLTADLVARHLIAAGQLLDEDPRAALEHARAARARAARVAVVREAVGIAAYHAEQWAEALAELRAARRISGDPRNLALLADSERALGRPAQALRYLNDPDVRRLDPETRVELLIVAAGARRDLGQPEAALAILGRGGLDQSRPRPGAARLWYAYADLLEDIGRLDEAAVWFVAAAGVDPQGELDAAERAAALL